MGWLICLLGMERGRSSEWGAEAEFGDREREGGRAETFGELESRKETHQSGGEV